MGKYADALKRINDIAEATDDVAKELKDGVEDDFVRRKIDFAATDVKAMLRAVASAVDGEFKDNPAYDEARRLVMMLIVSAAIEVLLAEKSDD